jgi:iron complex outermembrane recepter protein
LSQINAFFVAVKAISALLAVGSAHAATQLDEIVVTASRTEQTTFDAPAAIQSVTRETIENAGPQVNLSESLTRVPGVTILNRQNYAQDLQLSIRGFGARTAFGIRGVRILVDGIPATMPDGQGQASTISLTSTDRIEVLRGPLAQLYGNAAGGVIQAFTREAPESPELILRGSRASFDTTQAGIQYAAKAGAYGLVADYNEFETDGFRQNSTTKRKHFNGKLSWSDGPTKLALVANVFDMPKAFDPGGLGDTWEQDPTEARSAFITNRARKTVEQTQLGLVGSHRYGNDIELSARAYSGMREVFQAQSGATWIGVDRDYYGFGLQLSQNNRMGEIASRWTVGLDWDQAQEDRTGGATGGVAPLGDKTPGSLTRNQDYVTSNNDLYGQLEVFPSEYLTLIAGIRSSAVKMDVTDRITPAASGQVTHRATSPVVGISWHLTPTVNLYANVGKGFETPSIAETSYTGLSRLDLFNRDLKPSKSEHREAGLKAFITPGTRLDIAFFDIDTNDEIVVLSSGGGKTSYTNAAKTNRRGAEIFLKSILEEHWRFTAAINLLSAKYSDNFQSGTTSIPSGNKLPGIPQGYRFAELAWSSTSWRSPPSQLKAMPRTSAALELISAGKVYANDQNDRVAQGYEIANIRLSHDRPLGAGRINVMARVDNALNKRYVGSVIVGNNFPYEPAAKRNWLLGAKYTANF